MALEAVEPVSFLTVLRGVLLGALFAAGGTASPSPSTASASALARFLLPVEFSGAGRFLLAGVCAVALVLMVSVFPPDTVTTGAAALPGLLTEEELATALLEEERDGWADADVGDKGDDTGEIKSIVLASAAAPGLGTEA